MSLAPQTLTVMGIDPGSRILGYGILCQRGNQVSHVHSGSIKCNSSWSLDQRLRLIHIELLEIIKVYKPQMFAMETIFHAKNIKSVFTLAHARGVAMLCASMNDIPVHEYSPIEVKRACSGYGRASKEQISEMMSRLFGLEKKHIQSMDQTDALSIALCHLNTWRIKERVQSSRVSSEHITK
ncbi:MAG: crossover junction endodeoxyribonuclease RuvC [Bdellovibrionota bacterium]